MHAPFTVTYDFPFALYIASIHDNGGCYRVWPIFSCLTAFPHLRFQTPPFPLSLLTHFWMSPWGSQPALSLGTGRKFKTQMKKFILTPAQDPMKTLILLLCPQGNLHQLGKPSLLSPGNLPPYFVVSGWHHQSWCPDQILSGSAPCLCGLCNICLLGWGWWWALCTVLPPESGPPCKLHHFLQHLLSSTEPPL